MLHDKLFLFVLLLILWCVLITLLELLNEHFGFELQLFFALFLQECARLFLAVRGVTNVLVFGLSVMFGICTEQILKRGQY